MAFVVVFFLFPLLSALLGVIERYLIGNIFVIGLLNLLGWLAVTFVVFNRTFLIWAVLNTLIGTLSAYAFGKRR